MTTEAAETPLPKKSNLRKFILAATLATGTFYVGSAFVSYHNKSYREIFLGRVPLGRTIVDYGETNGWDDLTVEDVATSSTEAVVAAYSFISRLLGGNPKQSEVVGSAKAATEKKVEEAKAAVTTSKQVQTKVEENTQAAKTQVQKVTAPTKKAAAQEVEKVEKVDGRLKKEAVKKIDQTVQYEVEELVGRAEAAIAGRPYVASPKVSDNKKTTTTEGAVSTTGSSLISKDIYDRPLPLGFEPPPGYTRPSSLKSKTEGQSNLSEPSSGPVSLPLIAPAVADVSEPIITRLASTIDNLASYMKTDPKAAEKAGDVLESAKGDLAALVERIDATKEQERGALLSKLDEQTREYTLKLLELEMESQDRLDEQEEGFRKAFELEKARIIQAYREKLDHELKTQTELINER